MSKKDIDRLVRLYGDRGILRDLDFFPEKLSDACRIYPYTVDTFMEVVEGEIQMRYSGCLCAKTIRAINEDKFKLGDKVHIIIVKED